MQYFFTRFYDVFTNRRGLLFTFLIVLCIILGWSASRLTLSTDVKRMIPQDDNISSLSNYLQHTKGAEKIVFGIKSTRETNISPEELIELETQFIQLLNEHTQNHINGIQSESGGIDEFTLYGLANTYLPVLMSNEELTSLDKSVQPDVIFKHLEQQKELLQTPAASFVAQTLSQDPLGLNFKGMQRFMTLNNNQYLIIENAIFTADSHQVLFFLEPKYASGDNKNMRLLHESIKKSIDVFQQQHTNIAIHYFGGSIISLENAQQMQQDTIVTLSITIIALVALTWYIFKRKRIGFLLMLPVLFGILFSLGIISFVVHEMSVLALGVGAIILGIALDFSIHYLNHAKGSADSRTDVAALATPLSLGAFTTIGAFFILNFAHSSVLKDIGLFASLALTGASLFTLIFLPHLVDAIKLKRKVQHVYKPTFIDKWAKWKPEQNKILLILVFAITPVLWYFSKDVKFNGDLMALNYMSEELKLAEENFNSQTDQTLRTIYLIAKDHKPDKALEEAQATTPLLEQLKENGNIVKYTHPAYFMASQQQQADVATKWNNFWTESKIAEVQTSVNNTLDKLGINRDAVISISDYVKGKAYQFSEEDKAIFQSLMPANISQYADTTAYITMIQVLPAQRDSVIQALRAGTQNVVITDNQSTIETLLQYLNEDFTNLAFYSGLLVFLALLIVYGRLELALIAFLPMAISWFWILGIMSIFGLEFNVVNIIICTLIFGLGDDYSIFMMDGLIEKYKHGKDKILVSRSAIYLSALTTIIGLGVLIFAEHPAMKSIALIAVVGIMCVVLVSQILQPFLFNLFIQHRADKGFMPFTLWSFTKSIFAFTYFLFGCLLLTILGLILVYLKPFGKEKSKYIFHYCLSKYTKSVLYVMGNIKKNYQYTDKNYAEKPAIYVANHTSFLDILITIGLHPKVILVTADWVWNSPAMGKIVQLADFYPATEGAVEGLAQLARMRDKGYSIVIFPEGTRSKTDKMLKFKKGAFYMAEQLGMDIQPIVIHGASYNMGKGDYLLKDGQLNVYVQEKISLSDENFGTTVVERRKKVAQWYKKSYTEIKSRHETPSYFRETIIKSHLYKGPVLEWYCRIKTKLENNYEHFHALLPQEGNFYDLGCGYGFMTYMLHWSGKDRRFIGLDYDEEKISTAQHNYYFNSIAYTTKYNANASNDFEKGLSFATGDLTNISLQPCNGILLMDALHYLLPEQQSVLLQTCYDALLPGGILILRDGVIEEKDKHKTTEMTERFSTKIFKFNQTKNDLHFISKDATIRFFENLGAHITTQNFSKSLSNVTFIAQKPLA